MRVESLYLDNYKNLSQFSLSFDEGPITTLVGRNGTGKSNVLEALTLIFRDLDLGEPPTLDFGIDWTIKGHQVSVRGSRSTSIHYTVIVDGKKSSLNALRKPGAGRLLPRFVFGYYSGPSQRMEQHFLQHQRVFYRDLLAGRPRPLRPLFYARPVHAQFVLLAFFLSDSPAISQFLDEYLRIVGFNSALFVLQQPDWESPVGDPRFWNARGTVRTLLDALYDAALAPMRVSVPVNTGRRRPQKRERLYLFLPTRDAVKAVRDRFESDQEFFKALESIFISNLLAEVRVGVRIRDSFSAMSFTELSEGEQQLLMVLGLLRFTSEEESLLLLDEPDTHLNPAWSLEYRRMLLDYGGAGPSNQIILLTHDPLVIADQLKGEVRVMQRDADGKISASAPVDDPRGQGVAGLLTSEIYGLESELDITTREELYRLRQLASKRSRTAVEDSEMAELSAKLRLLDMTNTTRDPLYTEFARAMARREAGRPLDTRLSSEALARRRLETDQVLDEILRSRSE